MHIVRGRVVLMLLINVCMYVYSPLGLPVSNQTIEGRGVLRLLGLFSLHM